MNEFHLAASQSEVNEGEKILVEVDDRLVILFCMDGKYYCLDDVCTHDGGSLYDGELDHFEISCPRHGAKFDVRNGSAMCMPATQPTGCHQVKVDDGKIYVQLAEN